MRKLDELSKDGWIHLDKAQYDHISLLVGHSKSKTNNGADSKSKIDNVADSKSKTENGAEYDYFFLIFCKWFT